MRLFECRTRAIAELETNLRDEAEVIDAEFLLIERCIADLESRAGASTLARAAGLATAKGKLLAQGCYSLVLDGLAQESGALLRPLIEVAEFLTYLHVDDRALNEFTKGKLPKSGEVAGRIDGQLKLFRDYLNEDASHLSFSFNSLRHIIKLGDSITFNTELKFHAASFHENLRTLFTFLSYVLAAAVVCIAKDKNIPLETEPLAAEIARCLERGRSIFHIDV